MAADAYDAALLALIRDLVGVEDNLAVVVHATGQKTYLGNGAGI